MKTVYKQGTKIVLKDSEYKTSGGEGDIYIRGNEVFKVYQKNISSNFQKKFDELSILEKDNIIKPQILLFDSNNNIIGYTMDFVQNADALPLLFTTTFRDRNKINNDNTKNIVENMIKTIQYIHEKKILIIDANEYNFMVSKKSFEYPYFIDVDSYQTPSYPATAIMPSIRDYSVQNFNELSDWFSFAIVAFQLYTGIHPYKGKHSSYTKEKYQDTVLEMRMRNSVSVFNKEVSIPANVRPFDEIPDTLRAWFYDLFENKKRLLPPSISVGVAKKIIKDKIVSANIVSSLMFVADEIITGHEYISGNRILYTDNFIYIGQKKYVRKNKDRVIYSDNSFYFISQTNGTIFVEDTKGKVVITFDTRDKMLVMMNRIYLLGSGKFQEFCIYNNKLIGMNSWPTNELATTIYYNMLIANVLGSYYFYIPIESNKCFIFLVKELKGYTIFDGYFNRGYACVIGFKNGQYDRFIFKIENNGYSIIDTEKDVNAEEINAVTNSKGVFILQYEDKLYLTAGNGSKMVNEIADIGSLASELGDTYTYKENKFSLIKMK